jgi:hypothetical protein
MNKTITTVAEVQEPVDDDIPLPKRPPQRQTPWHQPGLFDSITKRFVPLAPKVSKKPPLELIRVSQSSRTELQHAHRQ